MTVLREVFFASRPVANMRERSLLAGKLLAACVDLNKPFTGNAGGWRVVIAPALEHREMYAEDLGISPEMSRPA